MSAFKIAFHFAVFLALLASARAEIFLAPEFSDNMVVQRGSRIRLWGTSTSEDPLWIEYQLGARPRKIGPRDMRKTRSWEQEIEIPELPKGSAVRPGMIRIWQAKKNSEPGEKDIVTLNNVMIGDVWLVAIPTGHGLVTAPDTMENVRYLRAPDPAALVIPAPVASAWSEAPQGLQLLSFHFAHALATHTDRKGIPLGIIETTPEAMQNLVKTGFIRNRAGETVTRVAQITKELLGPSRKQPNNQIDTANERIERNSIELKHHGAVTNQVSFRTYGEYEVLYRGDFIENDVLVRSLNFEGAIRPVGGAKPAR